jgi:HisA/HisF family protein
MQEIPTRQGIIPAPRLIPVMDLLGGQVVRAIAGRREAYRPLVSRLTNSTDPLIVAESLRQCAATHELYLADLDAIIDGARPQLELLAQLARRGFRLWVDAGMRCAADGLPLTEAGVHTLVASLESLNGPSELQACIQRYREHGVAFSLDLRDSRPIARSPAWPETPQRVIAACSAISLKKLIVLDLQRVGVFSGTGTEELCAWTSRTHPGLELVAGGGVRGPEDLQRLGAAGVAAVLVASALHDGRLQPSAGSVNSNQPHPGMIS